MIDKPSPYAKAVGDAVKSIRIDNVETKRTQASFAALVSPGLSTQHFGRIERGERSLTEPYFGKIRRLLLDGTLVGDSDRLDSAWQNYKRMQEEEKKARRSEKRGAQTVPPEPEGPEAPDPEDSADPVEPGATAEPAALEATVEPEAPNAPADPAGPEPEASDAPVDPEAPADPEALAEPSILEGFIKLDQALTTEYRSMRAKQRQSRDEPILWDFAFELIDEAVDTLIDPNFCYREPTEKELYKVVNVLVPLVEFLQHLILAQKPTSRTTSGDGGPTIVNVREETLIKIRSLEKIMIDRYPRLCHIGGWTGIAEKIRQMGPSYIVATSFKRATPGA